MTGFNYYMEKLFCRITFYKIVCYTRKLSYYSKELETYNWIGWI